MIEWRKKTETFEGFSHKGKIDGRWMEATILEEVIQDRRTEAEYLRVAERKLLALPPGAALRVEVNALDFIPPL